MALRAVVDKIEDVPEAFRAEYAEMPGGTFVLDVTGVEEMPAVAGVKQGTAELLRETQELQQRLEAFGDTTPQKIAEWTAAASAARADDPEVLQLQEKIERASREGQLAVQRARDVATAAGRAAEEYFLDSEIARALNAAEGEPALLMPVMRQAMRAKRGQDGKFVVEVIGKDQQPRIKDSQMNPFTVDDLALELRQDKVYGRAFNPSGSIRTPSATPGTIPNDPVIIGQNIERLMKGEVVIAGIGDGTPAPPPSRGGGALQTRTIPNDPVLIGQNLEGIAKGEVTVDLS